MPVVTDGYVSNDDRRFTMLLESKVAVVYGGAGAMGSAAASALANEGARVFLVGRTRNSLEVVAKEINDAGGRADVAELDVFDRDVVEAHADAVVATAGRLDVSYNAVGMNAEQEIPLVDMTVDQFLTPIVEAATSNFITVTAAAKRMAAQGSGVIVTLSTTAAREWRHRMGGFNVACAGIEALSRRAAHEFGRSGVRVVCIRPNFTPDTHPELVEAAAEHVQLLEGDTALGRLPRVEEVANAVVFAASDRAGAISGAVLNLSCGAIVD
jgi:3-oxoacyl-[acyl-carrier protein] reductase